MNIGTMVIRAYTWHDLVPGIIIEEQVREMITNDERDSYSVCEFVVQWSDGTQTIELYDELDTFLDNPHIRNAINKRKKTNLW